MWTYALAVFTGAVVGFVVAGLLASCKMEDLERENIHLKYDNERLNKLMGLKNEQ
jgi:hypothetical protein